MGVKELDFLGYTISENGVRPSNDLISKLSDMKHPKNRQELRELYGLCLQLLNHQYCQHDLLMPLNRYKKASPEEFQQEEFKERWMRVIQNLQRTLWHTHPWRPGMQLKMYIDVSFAGYGAVLLGDDKVIAMSSCGSSKPYQHSTTSRMEGLVRSLRAFRSYFYLSRSLRFTQTTRMFRECYTVVSTMPQC